MAMTAWKRWKKRLQNAACAALLGGMLWCPGAGAAPQEDAAMQAFRESIWLQAQEDRRVFRSDLLLITPTSQGELDFLCKRGKNGAARFSGSLDLWIHGRQGDTAELSVPFYADQSGHDMGIYFQVGDQWLHYDAPTLASYLTALLATPTREDLQEELGIVKQVELLQDSPGLRTMRVTLDGAAVAEYMAELAKSAPADKGLAGEDDLQGKIIGYMNQGFRAADPTYTWSILKKDSQIVAMSYNLSGVVRAMAKAALEDPDQHWSLETRQGLAYIAYYGELLSNTTFLDPKEKSDVQIPQEIRRDATDVDDMLPGE